MLRTLKYRNKKKRVRLPEENKRTFDSSITIKKNKFNMMANNQTH